MKRFIGVALALAMLSGCATAYDVDLNADYVDGEKNGQDNSEMIVEDKTVAITSVVKNFKGQTATENALMNVIAIGEIARIKAPQFHVEKPTLNTDNVKHVTDVATGGIPIFGMAMVSKTAMEQPRSSSIETVNGDIDVTDSMNNTATHTNTMGDGSPATSTTNDPPYEPMEYEY